MLNLSPFEIITLDGKRFRCNKPDHFWQYGIKSGTIDVYDKTVVEVLRIDDEEDYVLINTFSNVIMVGCVNDDTLLIMPSEKRTSKCPSCGFIDITNNSKSRLKRLNVQNGRDMMDGVESYK